ncbi:MAG: hypothetical protein AAF220_05775 [Pseudomonadota bacterium]
MFKLNIFEILPQSFKLVFSQLPLFGKTVVVPLVASGAAALAIAYLLGVNRTSTSAETFQGDMEGIQNLPPQERLQSMLDLLVGVGIVETLLFALCTLILSVPFAAAWHRITQQGATQLSSEDLAFKFGPMERTYLKYRMVIHLGFFCGIFLAQAVVTVVLGMISAPGLLAMAATVVILVILAARAMRASLVLAATAVGDQMTLRGARELGKGAGGEMLMIAILIHIPFFFLIFIVELFVNSLVANLDFAFTQSVVTLAANGAMVLLIDAVVIAAVSQIYMQLKKSGSQQAGRGQTE